VIWKEVALDMIPDVAIPDGKSPAADCRRCRGSRLPRLPTCSWAPVTYWRGRRGGRGCLTAAPPQEPNLICQQVTRPHACHIQSLLHSVHCPAPSNTKPEP
jgi:hypothetical protein